MRGIKKSVPVLFLLVVSLAFLWEAALFRKAFFYFDIVGFNLPMRQILGERLREGGFPLWSRRMFCGFPVFAEGQGGFLYPPNLLLFPFLEAWKAFNLSMVLNFFLGSCFMYAYLRKMVSTFPALVGGVVFAYCGFFLCHSFHTAMINVFIWLPLLFLFADRALEGGGLRPVVLGACVLALMIFAGYPNAFMVSLVGFSFYLLYRGLFSGKPKGIRISLLVLLLVVIMGLGLGGVQLFPMAELIGHSTRAERFPYDFLVFGSYSPSFFATLLLPDLFGIRGTDTIWFHPVFPYHEMDVYLGVLPLLFLLVGLLYGRGRRSLTWFALWITAIVLMLGKYTPFYHIFSYLPYYNRMRQPCRFDMLFCFTSSVLIAFGAERLFSGKRLRLLPLALGIAALIVFTAAVYCVSYDAVFEKVASMEPARFSPGWQERLERLRLLIASDVRRAVVLLVVSLAVVAAAAYQTAHRGIIAAVSLIVILADLFLLSRSRIALIEPSLFTEEPPTVAPLREDDSIYRIYSDDIFEGFSYGAPGWLNDTRPYFYALHTLPYDTQCLYGVSSIRGGSPLVLRRMGRVLSSYRRGIIDMLNGRYIFAWRRLPGGGLEPLYERGPFVYRNNRAVERAYVVPEAVFAGSEEEAFGVVTREGFDPRDAVVIEDADPWDFQLPGRSALGLNPEPEIAAYSDHEVVVDVEMPYNGFLVLSDTYYPGWHAEDNGSAARIYRANYLVRAVYLEEGSHRVRFSFRPASFRAGRITSVMFGIALLILYLWGGGRTATVFRLPDDGVGTGWRVKLLVLLVFAVLIAVSLAVEGGHWEDAFRTLRIR